MSTDQDQKLDPELRSSLEKKALKTVRALCAGNGINASSIRINGFDPLYYQAECDIRFVLRPDIKEDTIHGRHPGEVCNSKQEAQQIVHNYMQQLSRDSAFHESLKQSLLSRSDKGLGISKGEKISMTNYQKSMVWHEQCGQCGGQGQTTCHQCQGHRQERCVRCHGTSKIQCVHCGSTGRLRQGDREVQCHYCHGTGQAPCDLCRNTGKTPCRNCGARGVIACKNCGATGWFTHIYQVIVTAVGDMKLKRDQIPQSLGNFLERTIGKMAEKKAIKIESAGQNVVADQEGLNMTYDVSFPYGEVDFLLKDKPVSAAVFGYNAKLINLPPVLDRLITPGMSKLENAAKQKGDIAKQLKEASKYKIIALGLLQAARYSMKKTAFLIKRKYPMGVSDKTIQAIAKYADKATTDISKKPRMIGMIIGLMVSAILFGSYIMLPLRSMAAGHIANPMLHSALDLLLVGICSYLTILVSQLVAKNAMQTALGHLLPPDQRSGLMPKAGNIVYFAMIGCALLFIGMCEISIQIQPSKTPSWYANLRGTTYQAPAE